MNCDRYVFSRRRTDDAAATAIVMMITTTILYDWLQQPTVRFVSDRALYSVRLHFGPPVLSTSDMGVTGDESVYCIGKVPICIPMCNVTALCPAGVQMTPRALCSARCAYRVFREFSHVAIWPAVPCSDFCEFIDVMYRYTPVNV